MYAIVFDLNTDALEKHFSQTSPNNAYQVIGKILISLGFKHRQGSVYFGGEHINSVSAVLAAEELASRLPWFVECVSDIRKLMIIEDNDLMPAVTRAASNVAAPKFADSRPA
jgi:virulence-associated protein VapD